MKLLIIIMLFTSCGSKDDRTEKEKAAEKWFATDQTAEPSSPPACSIVAAWNGGKGLIYVPDLVTWGEAIKKAPPGKRLITRGEALLLWDQGSFKGLQFNIGQAWVASERGKDDSYALNTVSGELDFSNKTNVLGSIYIDL